MYAKPTGKMKTVLISFVLPLPDPLLSQKAPTMA